KAALSGPDGARVRALLVCINGLIKHGDFAQAAKVLDELEPLVANKLAATAPSTLLPKWMEAREAAGRQLVALQGILRRSGDPDLLRIAEFGLNGVTKKLQVGLQAALMEFDQLPPGGREKAAASARAQIAAYRKFLQGDRIVALLDENPFGVALSLRATL